MAITIVANSSNGAKGNNSSNGNNSTSGAIGSYGDSGRHIAIIWQHLKDPSSDQRHPPLAPMVITIGADGDGVCHLHS